MTNTLFCAFRRRSSQDRLRSDELEFQTIRNMEIAVREREERALLNRWREIEALDAGPAGSPEEDLEFCRFKEQWFSDAFRFLIKLPEETHIWCGYHEVMWPLLEPFGSFFSIQTS